jgi:hypothetical protein
LKCRSYFDSTYKYESDEQLKEEEKLNALSIENLGANYTKKKHPVKLVYYEKYSRIDKAFYREKQIQGWSHAKKKALIERNTNKLHELAECKNDTHFKTTAPSASLSDRVGGASLRDRTGGASLRDRTGGNRCPSGAEDEGVWSSIMGKK